jgi:hypothetical protein
MKKSEPKIILNLSLENSELDEKVKIALDQYTEQLIVKNLDDAVAKYVDKRINTLLSSRYWESGNKINGVSFETFVNQRTEQALIDAIDKNAKEILAKKLATLI